MSVLKHRTVLEEIREERHYRMLIGGEWSESGSGRWMDVYNPADGELLGKVPAGSKEDVDRAVAAGLKAFTSWKKVHPMQRGRILLRLADAIEENIDYLAMVDAIDSGNPVSAMKGDMIAATRQIRYFAGLAMELKGETFPFTGPAIHQTLREPFGVVGRIIPFNHPIMFAAGKIAAPIAAGNAVLLKPADQTPISVLIFAKLANEILPPGVLNVVTGGGEVGAAIVSHPKVKRIAFTGGNATAKKVMEAAAGRMKVLSMELGGKNPMLVLPDVDIDEVVASAIKGMNFDVSQGQSCGSTSNIFVHESMNDVFVEKLTKGIEQIQVGDPTEHGCQMGPLVSEAHLSRVDSIVKGAVAEGAIVTTGGERATASVNPKGYFYPPTVLSNVTIGMNVAREEVFGPVVSVISWSSEEELLQWVNDQEHGLTASIWTNDIRKAYKYATSIEAGYIWINDSSARFAGTPFGGYKESGIGVENSKEELYSYTQIKTINVAL